ncbi:MAG: hypothetical protein ACXW1O_05870 [Halobacteriota archaeon]
MITLEHARELLGDGVPNDSEFLELLDDVVKRKGEEWVKEHMGLVLDQFEYIATL